MARAWVLVLALTACGKVTAGHLADGGSGADAAATHLTAPVASIQSAGVAGASAQCVAKTAATGPGTITYVASWTVDGVPLDDPATTAFPGDTLAPGTTHTGDVIACTLFASDATDTLPSAPVSLTITARLAYFADAENKLLLSLDLDSVTQSPATPREIGKLTVGYLDGDLAWDAVHQMLYMVDGDTEKSLYTVDVTTGKATFVGAHGVPSMFALAFDPTSGTLYGGAESDTDALLKIDPASGTATPIGGDFNLDAMAYDTKRSEMMGLSCTQLGATQLVTLQLTTGAATSVNHPSSFEQCGMSYDPFIDKLWVVDESGTLSEIDPGASYAVIAQISLGDVEPSGIALALPPPP